MGTNCLAGRGTPGRGPRAGGILSVQHPSWGGSLERRSGLSRCCEPRHHDKDGRAKRRGRDRFWSFLVGQGPECEFLTVAFPCCKSSSWQFKSYPLGPPPSRLPPFYPPALLVQMSLAWPLLGCGSLYTLRSTSPSRTLNLTAGPAGISVHCLPRPRPPVWPPRCRGGHGGSGARAEVPACPAGARLTEVHNGWCFTSATVGLRTRLSFQCAEL